MSIDADLSQYRCQPEKGVFCPHLDRLNRDLDSARAEIATLCEHLAEQNRLLSLNVAEVERLTSPSLQVAKSDVCDGPGEEDGPWSEGWAERSNDGKGQPEIVWPTQCSKCGPSCQCDPAWNE